MMILRGRPYKDKISRGYKTVQNDYDIKSRKEMDLFSDFPDNLSVYTRSIDVLRTEAIIKKRGDNGAFKC